MIETSVYWKGPISLSDINVVADDSWRPSLRSDSFPVNRLGNHKYAVHLSDKSKQRKGSDLYEYVKGKGGWVDIHYIEFKYQDLGSDAEKVGYKKPRHHEGFGHLRFIGQGGVFWKSDWSLLLKLWKEGFVAMNLPVLVPKSM
jgi:hypothetical protein